MRRHATPEFANAVGAAGPSAAALGVPEAGNAAQSPRPATDSCGRNEMPFWRGSSRSRAVFTLGSHEPYLCGVVM